MFYHRHLTRPHGLPQVSEQISCLPQAPDMNSCFSTSSWPELMFYYRFLISPHYFYPRFLTWPHDLPQVPGLISHGLLILQAKLSDHADCFKAELSDREDCYRSVRTRWMLQVELSEHAVGYMWASRTCWLSCLVSHWLSYRLFCLLSCWPHNITNCFAYCHADHITLLTVAGLATWGLRGSRGHTGQATRPPTGLLSLCCF